MYFIDKAEQLKDKINQETNIVIWGYGNYGRMFHAELKKFTRNIYIYDKKFKEISIMFELMLNLVKKNGYVVIAVSAEKNIVEIYNELMKSGVDNDYVVLFRPLERNVRELRKRIEGFQCGDRIIKLLDNHNACELMKKEIMSGLPFLYSRWGSVEADAVFLTDSGIQLTENMKFALRNNAGMFSIDDESLNKFCEVMKSAGREMDIMCAFMGVIMLDNVVKVQGGGIKYAVSSSMEYPFFEDCSWTSALKGKKVLVIHPYAELIENQYEKREKLFSSPMILPEFELTTYKAVQSLGGSDIYTSWFDALEKMEEDISLIDFDTALIGCGAYGMPLGAFIKTKLKKQAIHIGGTLQILFGIKGKRWEGNPYYYDSKLYNDYWIRPKNEDRPKNYKLVENGCYW